MILFCFKEDSFLSDDGLEVVGIWAGFKGHSDRLKSLRIIRCAFGSPAEVSIFLENVLGADAGHDDAVADAICGIAVDDGEYF